MSMNAENNVSPSFVSDNVDEVCFTRELLLTDNGPTTPLLPGLTFVEGNAPFAYRDYGMIQEIQLPEFLRHEGERRLSAAQETVASLQELLALVAAKGLSVPVDNIFTVRVDDTFRMVQRLRNGRALQRPIETTLLKVSQEIDKAIDKCMSADQKSTLPHPERWCFHGWLKNLAFAWESCVRLQSALDEKDFRSAIAIAYELAEEMALYRLRRSYEHIVAGAKRQSSALEQAKIDKQIQLEIRKVDALAELKRRVQADPSKSPTRHIEDMARVRLPGPKGKGQWGDRKTLMNYGLISMLRE